jgi:hypothetical protein
VAPSLKARFGGLIDGDVTAPVSAENLKFWRLTLIYWDNLSIHATQSTVYPNAHA